MIIIIIIIVYWVKQEFFAKCHMKDFKFQEGMNRLFQSLKADQ